MMVNTVVMDAPIPLFGGSGVYINGGTVGGLDLMAYNVFSVQSVRSVYLSTQL